MKTRTGLRAGGSNADNHNFGPDVVIGVGVTWRFTIGRGDPAGHVFSPPMTRAAAKEGAALMLQGDESGARDRWGEAVVGWLDGRGEAAREALYEAARELMRA